MTQLLLLHVPVHRRRMCNIICYIDRINISASVRVRVRVRARARACACAAGV